MSVILSKAKNLALGGETLRFAQGDKGDCSGWQRGNFPAILSESGFTGFRDFQDLSYPVNPIILKILIQTIPRLQSRKSQSRQSRPVRERRP